MVENKNVTKIRKLTEFMLAATSKFLVLISKTDSHRAFLRLNNTLFFCVCCSCVDSVAALFINYFDA